MGSARHRVARICAGATDAHHLREELVAELRRSIGFDSYAFLLTDPVTSVGAAPLAHVPRIDMVPRLIRLKYQTSLNRWTSLTDPPVALLAQKDPQQSLLWRELHQELGLTDIASSVYRDRFGCWGFLDLWRHGSAAATFSDVDSALLADVAEPITSALRRCQAATFHVRAPEAARLGPLVLLLDKDLRVLGQTSPTDDYLRALIPPPDGQPPIPASAFNVAAQLIAAEAGVDDHPPTARVHMSGGLWLTLRAARIEGNIAVTIEESSPGERLELFSLACGLSGRERELMGHVMTGAGTREISDLMFLSEHTVQDHLKSIFAKTGSRSRSALVARVLG